MRIENIELKWLLKAEWGDFECFLEWGEPVTDHEETAFINYKVEDISFEWLDDFEQGQREPIFVREYGKNNYYLVNGHHRLFAAMLLGWDTLKALILDAEECNDEAWEISSDDDASTFNKSSGGSIARVL